MSAILGPSALCNDGETTVQTLTKVGENGKYVAAIRVTHPQRKQVEFDVAWHVFGNSHDAHEHAKFEAMNYFGVSRADGIWTCGQE